MLRIFVRCYILHLKSRLCGKYNKMSAEYHKSLCIFIEVGIHKVGIYVFNLANFNKCSNHPKIQYWMSKSEVSLSIIHMNLPFEMTLLIFCSILYCVCCNFDFLNLKCNNKELFAAHFLYEDILWNFYLIQQFPCTKRNVILQYKKQREFFK